MPENTKKTKNLASIVEANTHYSKSFSQSELQPQPTRHISILTCMDSRMDPYKFAGLLDGEAHIIRNAGGRATEDAIRSLIISHKFLGTLDWFVIHHTNCGMTLVTEDEIGKLLEDDLETAVLKDGVWVNPERDSTDNTKPGSALGKSINWHTFTDLKESVLKDMKIIRNHELVPSHINIFGFIFDVKTGKLTPVN
jgi:carbonic anhydrase